jgi:hypothetical protein
VRARQPRAGDPIPAADDDTLPTDLRALFTSTFQARSRGERPGQAHGPAVAPGDRSRERRRARPEPEQPQSEHPAEPPAGTIRELDPPRRGLRRPRRDPLGSGDPTHIQANATNPRVLWRLARSAARAGVGRGPDAPLPLQGYVRAQEEAALAARLRGSGRLLADVVGRILTIDAQLRAGEQRLHETTVRFEALERHHRSVQAQQAAQRAERLAAAPVTSDQREPFRRRTALVGPWAEKAALTVLAAGQAGLVWLATGSGTAGALVLVPVAAAVAVGSVVAAQVTARILDQLAFTAGGADHPRRRRRLDLVAGGLALSGGAGAAVAATHLRAELASGTVGAAWPAVLGLGLLGIAVAVTYAAVPGDPAAAGRRRRAMAELVRAWAARRRQRAELKAAAAERSAARRTLNRLHLELAGLAGQLGAAEIEVMQTWRQQAAIGDAAQYALGEHLAEFTARRGRGLIRRLGGFWKGRVPVAVQQDEAFVPVGRAQSDWPAEVARLTRPAREALVRRRVLTEPDHARHLPEVGPRPAPRPAEPQADQAAEG